MAARARWARLRSPIAAASARLAAGFLALAALAEPATAQGAKNALVQWVSRQYARGLDERSRVLSAVALAAAIILLIAAYFVSRRLERRREDRSSSVVHDSLVHLLGVVHKPDLLRIGDLVDIESAGPRSRRFYASRVEDMDPRTLTLATPRQEGAIVPLHVGDNVAVVTRTRPDAFRFDTTVLSRRGAPLPCVVVERHDRMLRFQRREFFRVSVSLDCRFEVKAGAAAPTALARVGTVVNISGAGCRIRPSQPPRRAKFVVLEIRLPGRFKPIRGTAEVVKRHSAESGPFQQGTFACSFIEVSHQDRELLVAYVMASERERIRRAKEREWLLAELPAGEPRPRRDRGAPTGAAARARGQSPPASPSTSRSTGRGS